MYLDTMRQFVTELVTGLKTDDVEEFEGAGMGSQPAFAFVHVTAGREGAAKTAWDHEGPGRLRAGL